MRQFQQQAAAPAHGPAGTPWGRRRAATRARWRRVSAALLAAAALAVAGCTGGSAATGGSQPGFARGFPTGPDRTWADEAIYFIVTDRFANGDPANDGDAQPGRPSWWQGGDLKGVRDKLDYIQGLGMTAIWITPVVLQMPGNYHGYAALDLYQVDPHLGDLNELKELVQAAHRRGLKVVLDVVLNHLGQNHPWLRDPGKQDWFHPRCSINWQSQKSIEDCWLFDLPDLNTENPAVRRYLTDWTLWLTQETGVDGFRLDTARHLPKDFLQEWAAAVHARYPGFWILGEVWSTDYSYQAGYLAAGLDAVTDFQTYESIRQALGGARPALSRLTWPPALAARLLPRSGARATFLDNHDVPRFVGLSPSDEAVARLKLALAYLFTVPGTPVLYYGTEVALPGGKDPDNRRFMPWESPPRPELREYVTALARLRQSHAALRRGEWVELHASQEVLAYARRLGDQVAVVALNAGGEPWQSQVPAAALGLPEGARLTPALAAGPGSDRPGKPDSPLRVRQGQLDLTLPPQSAAVWVR